MRAPAVQGGYGYLARYGAGMTKDNLHADVTERNRLAAMIGSPILIDVQECKNVLKNNAIIGFVSLKNKPKLKAIDGFLTAFGYQSILGRKIEVTTKGWSALSLSHAVPA